MIQNEKKQQQKKHTHTKHTFESYFRMLPLHMTMLIDSSLIMVEYLAMFALHVEFRFREQYG